MLTRRLAPALAVALVGLAAARAPAEPPAPPALEPAAIRLDTADGRQQIAVTAPAADGAVRDRTEHASYRVEPPGLADASPAGVVSPRSDGEGTLVVTLDGATARVPLAVRRAGEPRPASYRRDVVAVLAKAGCNMGACHGNLNGKGGFRLSLRGFDPDFDLLTITREHLGRRVDRLDPDASLLLRKPLGTTPHEGGARFRPDSPEARALRAWIADGAGDDRGTAPPLARLDVSPRERRLAAPGLSQQLIVTAAFADGTTRDVTRQAAFDVSDPSRFEVTPDGKVLARAPGEVTVAVRYLDGRGISRLAFLHDRPDFAWDAPPPANVVDDHVFAKLKSLRINPSRVAGDPTFLRRAHLDAIGRLPGPDEARAFLDDPSPSKRARLVDDLLARPEFADFWALKWADLLRNEEKVMGPKGVWIFQRWLRDQVAADVPLDQFARALVSARGSTWRNPPASFYRTNRDATAAAESLGQVFLGVRLQCARCHNHPFDVWTQDDYYGLAATFSNLGRKQVNNERRDRFDKHENNGDELIYLDGKPELIQPRSGGMMAPRPPGGPALPLSPGDADALDDLADWLTRDNPQFTRNLANRVWFHLVGRGVVDPVDDFRDSNPPVNPALLDALSAELERNGMRLRPLVRLIMTSTTYALDSAPNGTNGDDDAAANFARATVKLLPAEVLFDAIGAALESPRTPRGAPGGVRAVQFPGVRGGDFLRVFGKPDRLLTCECERSDSTTLAQAFQLINGDDVRGALEAGGNRIGRLLDAKAADEAILDELYLAALSRFPADAERAGALAHVRARRDDPRRAWEDVAWALLNAKEFLLRH
jgi:hypothetical protein